MPGTIRVSVLEAVDLPVTFADGTVKDVTAKVSLGMRQFETDSRVAIEGRIDSWNSDFVFLVTNLRDKLVVAICDNEDQCLTQTSIEVPSIIEKGCRDEFVELKGGGRIHLNMSFVLTDEERRKIETMRLRVLERGEKERVKRTIVFQNVQPISENELKAATVSAVTITEVDNSSTHGNKDSQESANGPLGFSSDTTPLKPILMFDYARAVGLQSKEACKGTEKRSKFWAADTVSNEIYASIDGIDSDEQILRGIAVNEIGFGSPENATVNSSVVSCRNWQRAASSLTRSIDMASSQNVSPSRRDPSPGKVTLGAVKVLDTSLSKGRDEPGVPANDYEEDKWRIEGQRKWRVLEAEAAIMANSFGLQSILVEESIRNRTFNRGATHLAFKNLTQIWDRRQAIQSGSCHKDVPKFECPSGQGLRPEARAGPEARWAQKTGLETTWTSPEKARQIVRFERNGEVSNPFKPRAKILKLTKAASGSHEVCGDVQSLEERHSLTDSFGAVLNKVVGGAAILLVTLFMMWPIPEGSPHRSDGSNEGDT